MQWRIYKKFEIIYVKLLLFFYVQPVYQKIHNFIKKNIWGHKINNILKEFNSLTISEVMNSIFQDKMNIHVVGIAVPQMPTLNSKSISTHIKTLNLFVRKYTEKVQKIQYKNWGRTSVFIAEIQCKNWGRTSVFFSHLYLFCCWLIYPRLEWVGVITNSTFG